MQVDSVNVLLQQSSLLIVFNTAPPVLHVQVYTTFAEQQGRTASCRVATTSWQVRWDYFDITPASVGWCITSSTHCMLTASCSWDGISFSISRYVLACRVGLKDVSLHYGIPRIIEFEDAVVYCEFVIRPVDRWLTCNLREVIDVELCYSSYRLNN